MFIRDEIDISALTYAPDAKSLDGKTLFFDIETSGMSFDRSHTTVIGAAYLSDGKIRFLQWFADIPGSEPYIITDFFDHLKPFDTLVSYNGISFDVPYIKKRAMFWALPRPDVRMEHIDLFKYSAPFAKLFDLPNRKLKTIESGLFIERKDRASGADCIDLYRAYLRTGDTAFRDLILLHNKEDIVNLIDVMHIRAYHGLRNGEFQIEKVFCPDGDSPDECELHIECRLASPVPREFRIFAPAHGITVNEDRMSVIFKGTQCVKKLFRKDYKDYYYLPNEDMAIHKSVGQFVAKCNREQAKASTCYENITDVFFEQPEEIVFPSFREDYKDKRRFFRACDLPEDEDALRRLCVSVM